MQAARADIPPPPGARERALAEMVRAAGHACPDPAEYDRETGAAEKEFLDTGLIPYRVFCGDRKIWLVATPRIPRRAGAEPKTVVRPMR
jgi:hypothetical protein